MAIMGLLPTPTAFDYNSARTPEKWEEDKQKWADKGVNLQMQLKQMARLKMLPTPRANESTESMETINAREARIGVSCTKNLTATVQTLLKTPTAADAYTGNLSKKEQKMGNSGTLAQEILTGFVEKRGLLPTPAMSNYKGASSVEALEERGRLKDKADNLADQFAVSGSSSQLNPRFVLEMMGFPPDWTALPFQSGETNQSKQPETR
jgi:hypothetical protein